MNKLVIAPGSPPLMLRQADTDEQVIHLWLQRHDSPNTRRNYRRAAAVFLDFVGKPLAQVTVGDLQAWAAQLTDRDLAPATRATQLAALKSLFGTAHSLGYLPFNPAGVVKLPKVKRTLAERILAEGDVHRLLALEPNPRNRALLTLLYVAGLRVSELCALQWRDVQLRAAGQAQVTVQGKGGTTRTVLIPARAAALLGEHGGPEQPVFVSRKRGGHLDRSQVHRIVQTAARRAGLTGAVSPHWLRHAHASHALERGAAIHLVQQTLGHASVATTGVYLHARPNDSSALYLAV
jgi:site-specific recombinase XerD